MAKTEDSTLCFMKVSGDNMKLDIRGRCDDGSDRSMVSQKFTERAVLTGIGRLMSITPVMLRIALKLGDKGQYFSF